jgi:ammonia channel protein AmtB
MRLRPKPTVSARLYKNAMNLIPQFYMIFCGRSLVLLFLLDKIIGLRVAPEQEVAGLDPSQHGEEGYDFNS